MIGAHIVAKSVPEGYILLRSGGPTCADQLGSQVQIFFGSIVQQRFSQTGAEATPVTPAELARCVRGEIAR